MSFTFKNENKIFQCLPTIFNGIQQNNNIFVCTQKSKNIENFAPTAKAETEAKAAATTAAIAKAAADAKLKATADAIQKANAAAVAKAEADAKVKVISAAAAKAEAYAKAKATSAAIAKAEVDTKAMVKVNIPTIPQPKVSAEKVTILQPTKVQTKVQTKTRSAVITETMPKLNASDIITLINSKTKIFQNLIINQNSLIDNINSQISNENNLNQNESTRRIRVNTFSNQLIKEQAILANIIQNLNKLNLLKNTLVPVKWMVKNSYSPGDIVNSDGITYIALPSINAPPQNNPSWNQLSFGTINVYKVTSAYLMGDLVVYNKKVWQAKQAIPANSGIPNENNKMWILSNINTK